MKKIENAGSSSCLHSGKPVPHIARNMFLPKEDEKSMLNLGDR